MAFLDRQMTIGALLALPQEERQAQMRVLQACMAELDPKPTPPPIVNTQQGDGSVGVMTMPAAYTGTVLASTRDEDD